jgi:lipopolysaccharide/colanic/teichoic acid biosynthesis glycosyltransferase
MNRLTTFLWSLVERFTAGVFLMVSLPTMLLTALVIREVAGNPIIVSDELPGSDGAEVRHCYRFRTTGRGASFFHAVGVFLRFYDIDRLPGLWSVVCGEIRLGDFFASLRKRG